MKWSVRIALVAALALGVAGCKKPQPSPDYAEAEALHSKLYADKLDDAYTDPEMAQVEELLARVPADSADHAAAVELQRQITSERAKVTAENTARQKAIEDALKPVAVNFDSRPMAPAAVEAPPPAAVAGTPDAGGPTQPETGMSSADFEQKFSGCFTQGTSVELTGHGLCDAYELKDIANCRDRHPGFVNTLVLVGEGKVLTLAAKSKLETKVRTADGGLASLDGGS